MSLVILGINHRNAPLELLERMTIPAALVPKALADLAGRSYVSEAVLLSTCNRTEVYVHAEKFHGAYQDVRDFMAQFFQVAPEDFADHLYVFYGNEAVEHLFRVTAGLDSAVLGEHEIQGQVKHAWETAQEEEVVSRTLNDVFRHALEVGKRARTETEIGRHVTSVSQAAVVLAQEHLDSLEGRQLFVLGAGDMGGGMTAAAASAVHGLGDLVVASRTWARAQDLAERFAGRAVHLDEVDSELVNADVVFTSTSATSYMIEYGQMVDVMERRNGRELLIVDIAMPRDVDPAVHDITGVTVLDMGAVEAHTAAGRQSRLGEVDRVRTIIETEVLRHEQQQSVREAAPLISSFRGRAEEIRSGEMERFDTRLASLDDEQRKVVEALTRGIIGKLMFEPTAKLKESADSPRGDRLGSALRELFDL